MHLKKLYITFFFVLLIPLCSGAEVIYLKDGTKIKAAKVWEDNGYIKFSPEGYEGIVITYAKEIVDRIVEKELPESAPNGESEKPLPVPVTPEPGSAGEAQAAAPAAPDPGKAFEPEPSPPSVSSAPLEMPAPQHKPLQKPPSPAPPQPSREKDASPGLQAVGPADSAADAAYSQFDGIQFYEPRRTYKYRTGPNTWHRTLEEALAALASTFERSPDWVEQHIGNTNDLGQIYRNLQQSQSSTAGIASEERSTIDGVAFYDPRRQYKYWVGETSKHRTLEEALDTLARQYDRSTDWVREHIGETNDLGQIHRNLAQRKKEEKISVNPQK